MGRIWVLIEGVLTKSRWGDIEVPCPDDRFLLVKVSNVNLEVFIPLLFRVERLGKVGVRSTFM